MKVLYIAAGVLMIVSGLASVFNPGFTVVNMTWFFGGVLIAVGISGIAAYLSKKKVTYTSIWLFVKPLITVLVGVYAILNPGLSDVVLGYLFGIWLLVTGLLQIAAGYQVHKNGLGSGAVTMIVGVIQVLMGLFAALNPITSIMAIGMMIGITFVVYGITLVTTGLGMNKDKDGEKARE